MKRYRHDGVRLFTTCIDYTPGQFLRKKLTAGKAAVEFEPSNHPVNGKLVHKGGNSRVPRHRMSLAMAANPVTRVSQGKAAFPAGLINPGQFSGTGRADVAAATCITTQNAVPWQQSIQQQVRPSFHSDSIPLPDNEYVGQLMR